MEIDGIRVIHTQTDCGLMSCNYPGTETIAGEYLLCPIHAAAYRKEQCSAEETQMHQFVSGAKSTVKKPEYHLIPLIALQLLAERFGYGKARHGERNYRKGASDPEFVTDRVNHLIEHTMNYAEHRRRSDLAAVLCNAAILADLGAMVDDEPKEGK